MWPLFRKPPDRPLNETLFTVLDTELTGLNPKTDELLSIGALKMQGTRILLSEIFYREVYTTRNFDHTVPIHQILPSDIQESPEIQRILPEFRDFIQNTVLVGYNLQLDLSFIKKYFKKWRLELPSLPKVDIYRVYQWHKKKVWARTPFSSLRKNMSH